jgi:hypothetical protein
MYKFESNPAVEACDRCDLEALRTHIPLCTVQTLESCVSHCVYSKFVDGLRLLIDAGVPINSVNQETIISNNWIALVEYILEKGTNMDLRSVIISTCSIEMLDLFLSRGFDINQKTEGECSFFVDMMMGEKDLIGCTQHQIFEALIARGGNIYDTFRGMNVVATASIQHDDVEILEFCYNHNIDLLSPFIFRDRVHGTLLHVCVVRNAIKCAQYLLDLGIDRTITDIDGKLSYEMELSDGMNRDEIKNLIKNYEAPPMIKEPSCDK